MIDYDGVLADIHILQTRAAFSAEQHECDVLAETRATIENLRAEVERERRRLAACGAVALADTPESAAMMRDMHPDNRSASCDDVARRVDECLALRAELATTKARLGEAEGLLTGWNNGCRDLELMLDTQAFLAKQEPSQ